MREMDSNSRKSDLFKKKYNPGELAVLNVVSPFAWRLKCDIQEKSRDIAGQRQNKDVQFPGSVFCMQLQNVAAAHMYCGRSCTVMKP